MRPLPTVVFEPIVRRALLEDLGRGGDLTSDSIIPAGRATRANMVARDSGVVAGLAVAVAAFRLVDPDIVVTPLISDGDRVAPGALIAEVAGPARGILTAERTALNFLGHLSGIASATAVIADAISHTKTRVCCTRKTTPGLRVLEKYAVRAGGGSNHRFGLDDAVLIKDNHIAVAGGIQPAIRAVRDEVGHMVKIEVEVDTLAQLDEVLAVGADAVLLDNMDLPTLREAVARVGGALITEASGRLTADEARGVAETGVDLLSSGWLTHSSPTLDIGLDTP